MTALTNNSIFRWFSSLSIRSTAAFLADAASGEGILKSSLSIMFASTFFSWAGAGGAVCKNEMTAALKLIAFAYTLLFRSLVPLKLMYKFTLTRGNATY